MDINLEKAKIDDIPKLIAIEETAKHLKTYSVMVNEKEWLEEMDKNVVYLIKKDNETVGNIMYEIKADGSAYISGLIIDPRFQRQGIAKIATAKILDELKNYKRIYLVTHPENKPALKVYESFGFVIESRKENYFGDGEPRVVLALERR
jgi:[ribosomal protein S18]-alanine N-acetyltransferase